MVTFVIAQPQYEKIRDLAQQYRLTLLVLFGSQATGKTHRESDVDVAYSAEAALDTQDDIRINYELTLIFHTDHVDTVNLRHTPPLLLQQIADEGIALYEKTGVEFAALQVYALRRFREARPLFEIRREKLDAFVNAV